MPDIDDEHQPILAGAIPGLVLEVVVEHHAAPRLPAPGL
jgi:hypothetical protein